MDALKRLQANIRAAEKDLQAAMKQDLNKSGFESYMAEIGMVLDEVGHAVKKLPGWAKPKRARTPMSQFAAKSFILSEPYGVTLVMAPWNYPFLLSMDPVIGAVAAGNCVVLNSTPAGSRWWRAAARRTVPCSTSALTSSSSPAA